MKKAVLIFGILVLFAFNARAQRLRWYQWNEGYPLAQKEGFWPQSPRARRRAVWGTLTAVCSSLGVERILNRSASRQQDRSLPV